MILKLKKVKGLNEPTPPSCEECEDGDQFGVQLGKKRGIYVREMTV